jgi:hypothetical protein
MRQHQASRGVDGGAGQRILRGEPSIDLTLRGGTDVEPLVLKLRAVREGVRPGGDRLRLESLELVVALRAHLGRNDAVEILLQIHPVDDVQGTARVDEDAEAAAIRLTFEGNMRVGVRRKKVHRRHEPPRHPVFPDRLNARRTSAEPSFDEESFLTGGAQPFQVGLRRGPVRKASDQHAVDTSIRRKGDRAGHTELAGDALEGGARRLLARVGPRLHGEESARPSLGPKSERSSKNQRVSAGSHDPPLARRPERDLRRVALQSHPVEHAGRRRVGRRSHGGPGAQRGERRRRRCHGCRSRARRRLSLHRILRRSQNRTASRKEKRENGREPPADRGRRSQN